ncbi:MAG: hypothetical protein WC862_02590 [Patescibacteria group bacterium]
MATESGKNRKTLVGNPEHLFRIIQSIPSKKAEPIKLWLARVGYERVKEIEDPELATKRTRALYKFLLCLASGQQLKFIAMRIRGAYQSSQAMPKQAAILPAARERSWKNDLDDQWCQRKTSCLAGHAPPKARIRHSGAMGRQA